MNMNDNKKRYNAFLAATTRRASEMRSVVINPQFSGGSFIEDPTVRDNAIVDAAALSPLYSSMGEEMGARQALSDASAIRAHFQHNGMPSDDLLAAAHSSLENLFSHNQEIADQQGSDSLFSSISDGALSTEAGTPIRAVTAALTLPTMLANPMNDMVTYLPSRRYEAEIFNVDRVAGKTLGDMTKGQIMDSMTTGQYSEQRQMYPFVAGQVPDGSKKQFIFTTGTDTPAKVKLQMRNGSIAVYLNRVVVAVQLDNGDLYGQVKLGSQSYILSGSVDTENGIITLNSDVAIPDAATLHAEFEIDIENNPKLVPTIDHKISSFRLRPASRILGADLSMMANFKMRTEFGIDLHSQQLAGIRNWLANERAENQLRKILFLTLHEREFDAAISAGSNETWKDRYEFIRATFISISQEMMVRNKESGLKGMYAGFEFAGFIKMLPPSLFQPTTNRHIDDNTIHFIGTLMGTIKVFCVPNEGNMPADECLCYAKTSKIGKAPFLTGDVVPPTLYSHDADRSLMREDTIWSCSYDNATPSLPDYTVKLKLKNYTV